MTSSISYSIDDKDLDDAALWAVIDSAEASHSSSKSRKPLALKYPNFRSPPIPISSFSPPSKLPQNPKSQFKNNSPVSDPYRRPHKLARTCGSEVGDITSPLALVRTPIVNTAAYSSPEAYLSPQIGRYSESELNNGSEVSPLIYMRSEEKDVTSHCLNGRFPSVSLFKDYQNAAMAVGGRYHFTSMFLMKSKTGPLNLMITEMSNALNLLGGRFSDGWGSCERREKRFQKPNHDIPSTAETRAKNRACQDLLGIGEYRPGMSQIHQQNK
ncbi:uncharacterized protein [Euphorbia lathyris]|uniref:uncharacterized protein isoform X2 n=1 Tax=Euphorbia lathyris TaxID=212925 RepID=UPI003313D5C6